MAAANETAMRRPATTDAADHGSAVMICEMVTAWHNTGTVCESSRWADASPPGRRNVARHVCHNCGATVAGDEQFCPTCGTFLGYDEEPTESDQFEEFELGAEPPVVEVGVANSTTVVCPSCGTTNLAGNRHCEECGARLSQGPLPAAPRPAVQATAGVRAVVAIAGLLLGVILIALMFRIFGGGDPTTTTTLATDTTSTTAAPVEVDVLEPLSVTCSVEGIGSFVCNNLIAGPDSLYQINWPQLEADGGQLTITLRFRTAVAISRIDWTNIQNDDIRFRRNYRARALTISSDDTVTDVQADLQNVPGTQEIAFSSLTTFQVTLTVDSVWNAELVDEQVFTELAIADIQVLGRPAVTTGPGPTDPDSTDPTLADPDTTDTTEGDG